MSPSSGISGTTITTRPAQQKYLLDCKKSLFTLKIFANSTLQTPAASVLDQSRSISRETTAEGDRIATLLPDVGWISDKSAPFKYGKSESGQKHKSNMFIILVKASFLHSCVILYIREAFKVWKISRFVAVKKVRKWTKTPFFHTFLKVWIWPRPPPPPQGGKKHPFFFEGFPKLKAP